MAIDLDRAAYGVRFSVANTTEWGTDRRSALELIEDALNLRVPGLVQPSFYRYCSRL